MRDDELSYRQVAALFDIRNFNIIGNWEHAYDEGGMAGLSPYASVRRARMKKPSTKKPQPSHVMAAPLAAKSCWQNWIIFEWRTHT